MLAAAAIAQSYFIYWCMPL